MKEVFTNTDGATETLSSAQELAQRRNPVDPAPDTTEVFKSIRESKPLPKVVLVNNHSIAITDQTIDTLAFLIEAELADEAFLAKAREVNGRMLGILDKMSEVGPGKVTPFLFKKRDEAHAAQMAGKEVPEIPSREHVQQNFNVRRTGFLNQLVSITHTEVVPLCRPILDRFASALEESMRDMEVGERELCQAYGVPFEPSIIWKSAATVAARTALRLPQLNTWATPQHLLENLVTL